MLLQLKTQKVNKNKVSVRVRKPQEQDKTHRTEGSTELQVCKHQNAKWI